MGWVRLRLDVVGVIVILGIYLGIKINRGIVLIVLVLAFNKRTDFIMIFIKDHILATV